MGLIQSSPPKASPMTLDLRALEKDIYKLRDLYELNSTCTLEIRQESKTDRAVTFLIVVVSQKISYVNLYHALLINVDHPTKPLSVNITTYDVIFDVEKFDQFIMLFDSGKSCKLECLGIEYYSESKTMTFDWKFDYNVLHLIRITLNDVERHQFAQKLNEIKPIVAQIQSETK